MNGDQPGPCPRCATRTAVASTARAATARRAGPTELERKLLDLLAQGLTDEAVAKRLGVSVRTERRMIASLMRRLQASGRFEAGVKAAQYNWI
jgi:DNA-binding NarL/FixJ family response regulator